MSVDLVPSQEVLLGADTTTNIDLPPLGLRTTVYIPEWAPQTPTPHAPGDEEPHGGETPVPRQDGSTAWRRRLRIASKAVLWVALLPLLGILPFILVLRIAVVSYRENIFSGWESLGIGLLVSVLVVCIYIAAFLWTFGLQRRFFMPLLNACLAVMLCYSGYALFHLAVSNAKTEEVRSYYTSLHPFLRLAVKNLTLLDDDIVVTDTQRDKGDYHGMGLRARKHSLHYRQATGFVHAMDLRTKGRSKLANLLIELYFVLMGFDTLRHVGTADHLHVSLPLGKGSVDDAR